MAVCVCGGMSHYWQTVKWYYGCGGTEGVSLLADSEVVLWMWGGGGGLKVSHYWQTVKWYYGCGGGGD